MAYLHSVDYSADRVQTSPSGSGFTGDVLRLADMELDIERKIKACEELRELIIFQIEGMDDQRYVDILSRVYIHRMDLMDIAADMNYDYYWCCHLHSKGAQGGKKAMDRASGSGVFARDPDAMLDFAPLEITDSLRKEEDNKARIRGIERALNEFVPGWQEDVGQDERLSPTVMQEFAYTKLLFDQVSTMEGYISEALARARRRTAWRLEGIFREFPEIPPLNMWFDFPIHHLDESDVLKDILVEGDKTKAKKEWAERQKEAGKQTAAAYLEALEDLFKDGTTEVDYKDLANYLGKSEGTVKKDLTGATMKGGKFNPRHSKAFQEAGYVWKKGKIMKSGDTGTKGKSDVPE